MTAPTARTTSYHWVAWPIGDPPKENVPTYIHESGPPSGGERLYWLWMEKMLEISPTSFPKRWQSLTNEERDAWDWLDIVK